ncbi:MAG: TonB-dependent receptor [Sphingomicrobium sp.]|nr:TonB-dependent receptor [Sphingomonadales bacterium]
MVLALAPTAASAQATSTPSDNSAATAQDTPAGSPTAAATTAPASDAADTTIVVTGIRRSLQSAQNIRKNSRQIVDAVVAEDIGKLPDLNTAQTAARIPGVQVYRQGGEAQNVLVRGLPNFTTTYNGREIFTAETRVVALQDFPSSNIAALEVFKTSTADLVEPGLAGLVNVRSRQPFDFRDGQLAGSVWGLYTRQGRGVRPNFNLLATKRWNTSIGEIGLLVNGSLTDIKYLDAEISNTDFIADPTINGQRVRLPDIQRLFYRSGRRQRPSVNVAAQWKPSPDVEVYAEGLWQGFRNEIDDRLLEVPLYNGQSYSNLTLRPGTNLVSSGTVVGQPGSLFSFQGGTFNRTDTFQAAAGTRITRDRLKINLDLARTWSTFRGSTESVDRRWTGTPTINFNNEIPQFGITGINFADPSQQVFQGLFEENQRSAGRDWQARADVEYDFDSPILKNLQVGARWTDRNARRNYSNRYAFLLPLGINATTLPLDFEVFRGYNFQPTYNFASPTYDSIRNNIVEFRQFIINRCPAILPTDRNNGCQSYTTDAIPAALLYTAKERTLAGYGQLNLGNDNVDGIVGARVLRVRTRVPGAQPTGIPTVDQGTQHTTVLPNASLRVRLDPSLQLRLAGSKTETRPNFQDLRPGFTLGAPGSSPLGTENNPRTASGGNPFLQPFTSWNFDAAVEYYFSRTGFVSITGFHRSLKGFIQPSTYRFTDPAFGVVQISGPVNTGKGHIDGVELQGQTFFDFAGLPEWAHGFGAQANLTYLNAKTQTPVFGNGAFHLEYLPITDQLNGVSKWNYNLVGIYEHGGLSARLTYNGRSRFAASYQPRTHTEPDPANPSGPRILVLDDLYTETAHPAGRLDLSLNYNVNDAFTLFGDWTNITRTPFRQNFSSARNGATRADYVRYLRYDESTVSLGLRFRFGK